MFGAVDHIVVGYGVDGQLWNGGINQHVAIGRGRVARFIRDGGADGVVTVSNRAQIRRRHGYAPAAVCRYGGGVVFTVQRDRHRLARFGVGHAINDQILLRFGRIDDVVVADDVNRDRRRRRVHAVLTAS
ncbi:Uncharacterised protein [Enterobacter kobei]|nr:Uncharacterised protein [Enterobacter kobei]